MDNSSQDNQIEPILRWVTSKLQYLQHHNFVVLNEVQCDHTHFTGFRLACASDPVSGSRTAALALQSGVPKLIIGRAVCMADQAVFVCLFFYFT